ncbi:hypothetical protein OMP43_15495, partial [Sphingomonas sp. CBMAI 2297]|nr:hypothetical protein [Sphingomonas sp. CBMAI 2297]
MRVRDLVLTAATAALAMGAVPAAAQQQMTTVDPNTAIDSDLHTPPPARDPYAAPAQQRQDAPPAQDDPYPARQQPPGPAGQA